MAGTSLVLAVGMPAVAHANSTDSTETNATVRHVAGDAAPDIGLIGDSTLSGVRWFDAYGPLERFNFVLDAESCRRTVERSCWSREQYRPRNAMTALQDEAGDWGEVLVVMTGYNDSAEGFADGVEAIVDEARRQGIGSVVWLSLRTKGVDYEEPLHLANGSTYRQANRSLYDLADDYDGYLQIADWATYSADSPEWFEPDGAHLSPAGAEALSEFIAAQVDVVLDGGVVTADPPPWEEVRSGDEGAHVVAVQEALIAAGFDDELVADGVFGPQTADVVAAFQQRNGLEADGAVDETTAVALGIQEPPPPTTPPTVVAPTPMPELAPPTTNAARLEGGTRGNGSAAWWAALLVLPVLIWIVRRRRPAAMPGAIADETRPDVEPSTPAPVELYDHALEADGSPRGPSSDVNA